MSGVWGSAPIDEVLAGRLVVRVCEGATPGFTFYRRLLRCPLVKYVVCIDMTLLASVWVLLYLRSLVK